MRLPAPKWVEGRHDLQQDVGFSLTLCHTNTVRVGDLGRGGLKVGGVWVQVKRRMDLG